MASILTGSRFDRYAAPLAVALVVAVAVLAVPPVVLGELTPRTYALTAAVIIIAVGAVVPYALLVGLGTLPLLAAGVASFTAPATGSDVAHELSALAALHHVAAAVAYVLAAAIVGAIGIGANIGVGDAVASTPAVVQSVLFYGGGVIVAATFVPLQVWRYDSSVADLDRRTVLATVGLGGLLALSPVVAFWVFNGTV